MRRTLTSLLLLAAVACGDGAPRANPKSLPPCRASGIISVGQKIPLDCRFRTMTGETLRLGDLLGKPAILNFWASWCPNCVDEMPALEQAHKALGDKVRFLGANLLGVDGETEAAARRFAARFGVTYESIFDRGGLLYAHFSPRLFPPTTIWIDESGVVRHRKFGPIELGEIRSDLKKYLGVS